MRMPHEPQIIIRQLLRYASVPSRDDENFMKHSISRWVNGAPELTYKDVRYTKYDPMERKY